MDFAASVSKPLALRKTAGLVSDKGFNATDFPNRAPYHRIQHVLASVGKQNIGLTGRHRRPSHSVFRQFFKNARVSVGFKVMMVMIVGECIRPHADDKSQQ